MGRSPKCDQLNCRPECRNNLMNLNKSVKIRVNPWQRI